MLRIAGTCIYFFYNKIGNNYLAIKVMKCHCRIIRKLTAYVNKKLS